MLKGLLGMLSTAAKWGYL